MKKTIVFTFALLAAAASLRAANYTLSSEGPFLILSRDGGFSNSIVSIRKDAVISSRLEGKRIAVATSGVDMVEETMPDGAKRRFARSIVYTFDMTGESDARELYGRLMKALGS